MSDLLQIIIYFLSQAWQGIRKGSMGGMSFRRKKKNNKWSTAPKLQNPHRNKSVSLFSTKHKSPEENKLRINNLKLQSHLITLNNDIYLSFLKWGTVGSQSCMETTTWEILSYMTTSQILRCLMPQTLPELYASLDVRNLPPKRLELKVVVL